MSKSHPAHHIHQGKLVPSTIVTQAGSAATTAKGLAAGTLLQAEGREEVTPTSP